MSCCRIAGSAPADRRLAEHRGRANQAAMRWPTQASRTPTHSQCASRVVTDLPIIATTSVMHAMVR
jgi:hypothetical protein